MIKKNTCTFRNTRSNSRKSHLCCPTPSSSLAKYLVRNTESRNWKTERNQITETMPYSYQLFHLKHGLFCIIFNTVLFFIPSNSVSFFTALKIIGGVCSMISLLFNKIKILHENSFNEQLYLHPVLYNYMFYLRNFLCNCLVATPRYPYLSNTFITWCVTNG